MLPFTAEAAMAKLTLRPSMTQAPCSRSPAARTREDVFLLEEIEHIVKRSGGHLKAIIALSEPRNDDVDVLREQVRDFAQVFAGYAHDAVRELASAKPLGGIAFVSGSKPMVQATVKALILHGKLSPTAIRSDDFC